MTVEKQELDTLKAELDKSIKAFIAANYEYNGHEDEPVVMAWICEVEITSSRLIQDGNETRSIVVTPDEQLVATSLGLLHLGMENFNIRRAH